ncbi:bone sialoprotein 2 [Ahaetulla prasina]|uniref:bone sialoprotein 2 n=1 Tax=Ahaetulla prasina TaxID=499056 RepID=UPI00264900B7|nr:bone sialoprotein 2 [Ahaetulla prasina]
MKTALIFLCIIGITCAFSAKHFRRRFKSEDSEENAVFKNRYRHFLYRYPYFYPPMKRFQFNSDSSEEGFGGNSSEEEEEEEGGQSNEENEGGSEETTVAPTTPVAGDMETDGHAEPPTKVPGVKEPLQKPGKGAGDKKVENAPKKGTKEEDSDENEEEENEEEEEEKVDENGSGANATSTNSTLEETGNGGEEEEEEENEATTISLTTLVTTVNPTESSTGEQWQDGTTAADQGQYDTTTEDPWVHDATTTNGYEGQTDYYASENGYPRGDTFRTYEDEYSYYKGHGYDAYGQDYYYNQ